MIPNMLELAQNSTFQRFSQFPENFWKNFWKTGILNFWAQYQVEWQKLSGKNTQDIEIGQNQLIPGKFHISRFPNSRFQENWNFEILSSKSISVTKTEWEWYPICRNWPKTANSRQLPDFQISKFQISKKLEFWISEHKIKFSDKNWVGKIPNTLKLVKTSQFQAISRFPDSRFQKITDVAKLCKIIMNMLY